jgi:hypothetical protein
MDGDFKVVYCVVLFYFSCELQVWVQGVKSAKMAWMLE